MHAVTVGGPGLVAVGIDDLQAAVWTSKDGLSWKRTPRDTSAFEGSGRQVMYAVTNGGPGLVAVGEHRGDPAVWTSVDGLFWQRVAHAGDLRVAGQGRTIMHSVVSAGSRLVAVGEDAGRAAVWISTDGQTWQRIPHDEALFGGDDQHGRQTMNTVIAGGPGFVAVGGCRTTFQAAAVWTSADGRAWQRIPIDEAVFVGADDRQEMRSVAAGGPGLVAVGHRNNQAAVWHSTDGFDWQRTAYGQSAPSNGKQMLQSVIAAGPGFVAVGHHKARAAVWASQDGLAWQRVRMYESVSGRQSMNAVIVGGPGLVAVGSEGSQGAVWATQSQPAKPSSPTAQPKTPTHPPKPAAPPTSGTSSQNARGSRNTVLAGGDLDRRQRLAQRQKRNKQNLAILTSPPVSPTHPPPPSSGPSAKQPQDRSSRLLLEGTFFEGTIVAYTLIGMVILILVVMVWTSRTGIDTVRSDSDDRIGEASTDATADPRAWQRIAFRSGAVDASWMHGVAVGGQGLVAVGNDGGSAAAWTSTDGLDWQRVGHDEAVFGGDGAQRMISVTSGGPGLVAVGRDSGRNAAAVWRSSDGLV